MQEAEELLKDHTGCPPPRQLPAFPVAVEETVKRTTNCGFNYFTNRRSYYDVPENMVSFEELPDIPRPPKQNGTQQDLSTMRKWAKE